MLIEATQQENALVVSVSGRLDAVTAPQFDAEMEKLLRSERTFFLFHLEKLDFISSAGLRSILSVAKQLRPLGGNIAFAGIREEIMEVFLMTGFGKLFKMYTTLEEALAAATPEE